MNGNTKRIIAIACLGILSPLHNTIGQESGREPIGESTEPVELKEETSAEFSPPDFPPADIQSTPEVQQPELYKPSDETEKESSELTLDLEQLNKILAGDLSALNLKPNKSRNTNHSPYAPQQTAQTSWGSPVRIPTAQISKMSPEQCLTIAVNKIEHQIATQKTALVESDDPDEREELLKKLSASYQMRFEVDTAFQDRKVSEIERRAKKLRDDVEARKNATEQWVNAMVTLAKMKAAGIEIMDTNRNNPASVYHSYPVPHSFVPTATSPASTATPSYAPPALKSPAPSVQFNSSATFQRN